MTAEQQWNEMLDALATAPEKLAPLLAGHGIMVGSSAASERDALKDYPQRRVFIEAVPQRVLEAARLAGESVEGTTRLLRMPFNEVMSGPVVRLGFFAAGLVLWLLEQKADADERSRRMVSVRIDDLNNALRLATKSRQYATTPEQIQAVEADIEGVKRMLEAATKAANGLKRVTLPNDEVIGTKADAGFEYQLYTQLSHGSLAAIEGMRKMYRHDDPLIAGSGLWSFILAIAHAYFRTVWAVGDYILEGEPLDKLREALVGLYQAMNSSDDFYAYLR